MRPFEKRYVAGRLMEAHRLSRSRSCDLSGLARSTAYHKPVKVDDGFVRDRLKKLAKPHRRYGYLRIHCLFILTRDIWEILIETGPFNEI